MVDVLVALIRCEMEISVSTSFIASLYNSLLLKHLSAATFIYIVDCDRRR